MSALKVFVYGTLKPGEHNYNRYCKGKVVEQVKVCTTGKLYHLPTLGYPAMVSDSSGYVEGYLLVFAESNILSSLDDLEDYQQGRSPQQNEYNRHWIDIYQLQDGQSPQPAQKLTQAWGYIMAIKQVKQQQGVLIASGQWNSRYIRDYS